MAYATTNHLLMQNKLASLAVRSIVNGEALPEKTTWYYGILAGQVPTPKAHAWNTNRVTIYKSRSVGLSMFAPHMNWRPPLMNITPGDEAMMLTILIQAPSDCSWMQQPRSCAVLSTR